MNTRLRIRLIRNSIFILLIIIFITLIALIVMRMSPLMNSKSEQTITSGANVTELIDVDDIKKRMKFHGCLVCWRNPDGVWLFVRDGKNCELWAPKKENKNNE